MSKEMESHKFAGYDKKIRRTATKWAGFNTMLYVLYGLGTPDAIASKAEMEVASSNPL